MENSKTIFSSLFLAITVSGVANFYLPSYGVEQKPEQPFHQFRIYRMGELFIETPKKEKPKEKPKPKKEKVYNLKKWNLIATYLSSYDGFIILKDGRETETIYLDHIYKGYELVDIQDEKAIFRRAGKLYSIELNKSKSKKSKKGKKGKIDKVEELEKLEAREEKIRVTSSKNPETDEITSAKLKRSDINFYIKNMGQIWKNIRIKDYRVDRHLRGFKVTYVKSGSVFESLGLKAGDIITAINGEEIRSYSQVQKFYKNINRIRNLNLTISRNGEERDIDYEIN